MRRIIVSLAPARLILTARPCTPPDVERSVKGTILERTPHLNQELHCVRADGALGRGRWGLRGRKKGLHKERGDVNKSMVY